MTPPDDAATPRHAGETPPLGGETPRHGGETPPTGGETPRHGGGGGAAPRGVALPPPARSRAIGTLLACIVVGGHVLADLLLLLAGFRVESDIFGMLLLAWPMAQTSLVALWAAVAPLRTLVRYPLGLAGIVCTWLLTITGLSEMPPTEARAAGWAAMTATQAAVIVLVGLAGSLAWHLRRRQMDPAADPAALQFSIGYLMLWTAMLALILGLGKLGVQALGWTAEVAKWEYFFFCPVLGTFNALYALLVFGALVGKKRRIVRSLAAAAIIALLAYFEADAFALLFGQTGGVSRMEFFLLSAFQAMYVFATLLPLRAAAYLRAPPEPCIVIAEVVQEEKGSELFSPPEK